MQRDSTGNNSPASRPQPLTVVGLGESLFDVIDDRQLLGGAPLNAAVMAHQVLAQFGGRGLPASRVGSDDLGRRMLRELAERGISCEGIQLDATHATGRGLVEVVEGEPRFVIVEDAAWDCLQWNEGWQSLAASSAAVCFGTLGQRSPKAREAIGEFLRAAPQAIRLFDVNLRQHYYTADVLHSSCQLATIVKLNEQELATVRDLLRLPGATQAETVAALLNRYALEAVVVTHGPRGTELCTTTGSILGEPASASYPPHSQADAVGAGDAASAGILAGRLLGWSNDRTVALANHLGAFVASQPGATPQLPVGFVERAGREVATC